MIESPIVLMKSGGWRFDGRLLFPYCDFQRIRGQAEAQCFGRAKRQESVKTLPEGTIKRLTDKGFGFIDAGGGSDMFFHMSSVEGCNFDDLREGQRVSFTAGQGPKGPRAENVRVIE